MIYPWGVWYFFDRASVQDTYIKPVRGTRDAFLQLLCYVQEFLEWPVKPWRGVIKYNLTILGYFLFPRLLCQLFVFLLFLICWLFFSLSLFSAILPQTFGLHPPRSQKRFCYCWRRWNLQPLRAGPPERPSAIQDSSTGGDPSPLLYLAYRDGNQSGAEKDNRLLFREQ